MSGLGILLLPQEAHFILQEDIYKSVGTSTSFPIIQNPISNVYVALREIMLFPYHVTDERLYTVNSMCFKAEDSAHKMRSEINKQYKRFKVDLLDRGSREHRTKYYEEIVKGLEASHLKGYENKLIVKGQKSDGEMDDKNYLTTTVHFFTSIPHLRGLYIPPVISQNISRNKTSPTPEESAVS